MRIVAGTQRPSEVSGQDQEKPDRQQGDETAHIYSAGAAAAARRERAAAPIRQRRSLRLTMPPNAMITAPIQIQGTNGFQ